MRKLGLWLTGLAAVTALAGPAAPAPAIASADDWNQFAHDAARTSRSGAHGPVWPRIAPGWPVVCDDCYRGVATARLNALAGDSRPAVFAGTDVAAKLHGFDADGRVLPGSWPAQLDDPSVYGTLGYPAVATATGSDHIYTNDQGGHIYGIGAGGEALPGPWPLSGPPGYQSYDWPAVAVDGQGEETLYTTHEGMLHALRSDGSERPGWPVRTTGGPWMAANGPAVSPDGTVYILDNRLLAFTADGQPKPGWPYSFPSGFSGTYGLSGPSIDADGTVFVGVYDVPVPDPTGTSSRYYAFTADGEVKPGWPIQLSGTVIGTPSIAADGTTYLSVWEQTGESEQVAKVYAFDARGQMRPGWPVRITASYAEFADLNGAAGIAIDRDGNVYFASHDTIYGYDSQARPLPGWPVRVEGAYFMWPALASDGTLYLMSSMVDTSTQPWTYYSAIYALRSGGGVKPKPKLPVPRKKKIDDFTATPGSEPPARAWLVR